MVIIQNLPLKVIFMVHLILCSWAMQGSWLSADYLFYNAIFMLMLLWSIHHRDSEEPVLMSLALNLASIFLDVIVIAVKCPPVLIPRLQFSVAMAIMNLILRPITSIVIFRVMSERGGNYNSFGVPNLGNYFSGTGNPRGPYENIDQPVPQSVPQNNIDPCSPQHKGAYMTDGSSLPD